LSFPESFLAVDMFFLLSGFVIAYAYEARLQAGGFFRDFVKIRLIRLYPLYLAGLAVAVVLRMYLLDKDDDPWTLKLIVETAALALFMLPGPAGDPTSGYSLNSPSWTLLPELLFNVFYGWFIRWMTVPVLIGLVVICAAGLIPSVIVRQTLDIGYPDHAEWATPFRMGFSFFSGILMYRLIGVNKRPAPLMALACVAALVAALTFHPPDDLKVAYELALALGGFPLLILVAARVDAPGKAGAFLHWLGLISYGVYTLHVPIGGLVYELLKRKHIVDVWDFAPLSGLMFTVVLAVLVGFVDRIYDQPVRRWLTRKFLPAKS
jgi:peptidoglycan/LPS O-acetylase OafA/YrhL